MSTETKNKGGRPSKYSPELIEAICARLENGEPMAQICRDEGMPADRTVREWCESKPEVSAAIARAREIGFDVIALDGLEIVDNVEEDPASRRVRADYRLKLLAKWDPKRYGDRIQHANDPENPFHSVTDAQIDARINELIRQAEGE